MNKTSFSMISLKKRLKVKCIGLGISLEIDIKWSTFGLGLPQALQ